MLILCLSEKATNLTPDYILLSQYIYRERECERDIDIECEREREIDR